ncbi:MAG: rod shape-determining protein [Desulfobacteraceae bacterium]|nr:rod shape-determining protein [Desulfobacteraceae bacterium]
MLLLPSHKFWRQDVALDVGTATTRVAIGEHRLIEQPSETIVKRALRGGVVVDGDAAVAFLKPLLTQVRVFGVVGPRVLACAPSDVKLNERQLLIESIVKAGASSVVVIPEPLAAAVGAGTDVSSPYAQMVIDIGEGVSDCAVIQSSKILATCAVRSGCARMRREIVQTAERNDSAISDGDAEALLRSHGVAVTGSSSLGSVGGAFPSAAVEPVVEEILGTIDMFLRDLPHSLGCEIIDSGIWLSGGGALIPGIRERFEERTGISVRTVGNPLLAVIEGARIILPVVTALNQWR